MNCSITQVTISWETASAKSYTIEVSNDGATWETIVNKSNMPAGSRTDDINGLNAQGRYIRMYGTERTSQWGYSIFEFEVYGKESNITGIFKAEVNKLKLYPNFVRRKENLRIESAAELNYSYFWIYNLSGQVVKQGKLDENITSVYIDESFSPGMYILKGSGSGSRPLKFVVGN